jgi:nicotinamidase/pyrazinamidase
MEVQALRKGDVLVIVDVQRDFVTGSLPVPGGAEVIPPLNACIAAFREAGLPVGASRDWHPPDHGSFLEHGGLWPAHCVAGTPGAAFAAGLNVPDGALIVSKATTPNREAYSAFEGTDLQRRLQGYGAKRLFVGGLATDYCVLRTVLDARARAYETFVLADAIRAVDANPGDGERAEDAMIGAGAHFVATGEVLGETLFDG